MKLKAEKPKKQKKHMSRRVKVWILFIVLLIICAVPAVFQNNAFGYIPGILLILMFIFGHLYVAVLKKAVVFEEVSDLQNCSRGADSRFSVTVRNRSPLAITRMEILFFVSDIFGGDDSTETEIITMAPFEKRQFDFDVRFDHIGNYEAGLKKVTLFDIFGLFTAELDNEKRCKVRVSPRIYDITKLHVANATAAESKQTLQVLIDGNDYAGTREYVIGDPIKHIHWKQSARKDNSYMTKQFEAYGNTGLSIIIDCHSGNYEPELMMTAFDGIVESALSAEDYGRRNGMETEILYIDRKNSRKRFISTRQRDYYDLISDLPVISAGTPLTESINLLQSQGMGHYSQSNILFCTASVTPELLRVLQSLKMKRRNPILFVVIPDSVLPDERKKMTAQLRTLDYAGVTYYILSGAEELQGGQKRVS